MTADALHGKLCLPDANRIPVRPLRSAHLSAGRVALLVFGSLATLVALGALAAGAFGLWLHETKRDADGFYTTRTELSTPTYALSSEGFDIADVDDWPFGEGTFATVRLQGASVDPAHEIFIGIAPELDARRYLAGVEHDEVIDLNFGGSFDDATVDYRRRPGRTLPPRRPSSPSGPPRSRGRGRRPSTGISRTGAGRSSS